MKLPKEIIFTENNLPDEILDELEEFICDEISDRTGFCHDGFSYSVKININNIKWDTDED